MFIATTDPTTPRSVGVKCVSSIIFRSYGAYEILWVPSSINISSLRDYEHSGTKSTH
jgi:hypothetical protein